MGIEFRSDKGHLRKFEVNGAGGIRVDAALTRVGVFEYRDAAGNVSRELKGPETVFDARALQSLMDAPVTIEHPADFVGPENWKDHAVGHVSGVPLRDPAKADTVVGPLVIQDAKAIEAINAGELKEVSLGYFAEIVDSPGEYEGQKYDRIQRSPVYNHVAIGGHDWGRLGPEISLRINRNDSVTECTGSACMVERRDSCSRCGQLTGAGMCTDCTGSVSSGAGTVDLGITTNDVYSTSADITWTDSGTTTWPQVIATFPPKTITPEPSTARQTKKQNRENAMSIITVKKGAVRIDGVPHESLGESAQEALRIACDRARTDATEETAGVVDEQIKTAQVAFDLARENAELAAEVDSLKGLDIDALVNARAALIAKAKEVAPELVTDGKTEAEIVTDALSAAGIEAPEGASDDYKRACLDMAKPKERQDVSKLGNGVAKSGLDRILAEAESKRNNSLKGA